MPAGEVVLTEAGRRCSLVSLFFEACIICLGGRLYDNEI